MEKDGELGETIVFVPAAHRLLHQRQQLGVEGFKLEPRERWLPAAEVFVEISIVKKPFKYWILHNQPFTTRSVVAVVRTTSEVGAATAARASAERWSPAWSVAEERIISQRFP